MLNSKNKELIDVGKFSFYVPNIPLSPPNSEENFSLWPEENNSGNFTNVSECINKDSYGHSKSNERKKKSPKKSPSKLELSRKLSKIYPNLLKNTSTEDTNFNNLIKKISIPKEISECKNKLSVYCNVCKKSVNKNDIKKHLFFGSVNCLDCGVLIRRCSKFSSIDFKRDPTSSCKHKNLNWSDDPVDKMQWLRSNLGDKSENSFNSVLHKYLLELGPLESQYPWSVAIGECYDYINLPEKHTQRRKTDENNGVLKSKPRRKRKNSTEQIQLPEDGFYLIMQQHIEECPNCYESLEIKRFNFNARNALINTVCKGCSLPIYFVLPPPDGSQPKIQILHSFHRA